MYQRIKEVRLCTVLCHLLSLQSMISHIYSVNINIIRVLISWKITWSIGLLPYTCPTSTLGAIGGFHFDLICSILFIYCSTKSLHAYELRSKSCCPSLNRKKVVCCKMVIQSEQYIRLIMRWRLIIAPLMAPLLIEARFTVTLNVLSTSYTCLVQLPCMYI